MIRNFGLVSPYTTNEGNDGNKNIKMSKTNKQGQVLLKIFEKEIFITLTFPLPSKGEGYSNSILYSLIKDNGF